VFLAGLTALVVATPLVGLSVKAKVDPQGFKDTLLDSLPAPIAKAIVSQFLQDVPPKILDQKPAPSQTTKLALPTMDAAAVVMALPPSLAGVGARVCGCICMHFSAIVRVRVIERERVWCVRVCVALLPSLAVLGVCMYVIDGCW